MRIALLNWRDIRHPHAGGAEVVVDQQARGLRRLGHDVTLFTAGFPGAAAEEQVHGYRVIRLGDRFTVYPLVARRLRTGARSDPYEVVLEHATGIPWFAPLWSPFPTTAYFYHVIDRTYFDELPLPLAAVGYAAERLAPVLYRHRRVACLGEGSRAEFGRLGYSTSDLAPVYPGIDHVAYRPGGSKSPDPSLVVVGRIKRYKRLDLAIRALALLREQLPQTRLTVIGPDPDHYWPSLERLATQLGVGDAIDYRGVLSQSEKIRSLQTSWLNLVPSDQEGWGLTVIEAATCGTPSVGSDIGGLTDTLVPNITGVRFHQGDAADLAARSATLLEDEARRESMATAGIDFCRRFDWDLHVAGIEQLLTSVAERPRPSPLPRYAPGDAPALDR